MGILSRDGGSSKILRTETNKFGVERGYRLEKSSVLVHLFTGKFCDFSLFLFSSFIFSLSHFLPPQNFRGWDVHLTETFQGGNIPRPPPVILRRSSKTNPKSLQISEAISECNIRSCIYLKTPKYFIFLIFKHCRSK